MTGALGRHHPLLKRIRALRRSPARRRSEGVLLAEGVHLVDEALGRGAAVEHVLYAPALDGSAEGRALLARAASAGTALHRVPAGVLDGLQDARSPQPVMAVVGIPPAPADDAVLARLSPKALLVLLYGVQDPGNLGSLIRTAHAAGAGHLWLDGDGADAFHPRTVRASMGSVFGIGISRSPFAELIPRLRSTGVRCWAAEAAGGSDHRGVDRGERRAILLGREGDGVPDELARLCDGRITIPLHGGVDSLSVVAAGAVLFFGAGSAVSDG